MSDTTSLSELARFIGQSSLSGDAGASRTAMNDIAGRLARKPQTQQKVSDLLAVVLTLSGRTRRVVMPKVEIDLDVFMPDGARAVRMLLPE
ncbi:MAG: hypothetical protein ABI697_03800 [Devosia sp.]